MPDPPQPIIAFLEFLAAKPGCHSQWNMAEWAQRRWGLSPAYGLTAEGAAALLRHRLAAVPMSTGVAEPPVQTPEPEPPGAVHSLDYRSVNWHGTQHTFTPSQAAAVKLLWEHWDNGTPELGEQTILEAIDSTTDRLVNVFRSHEAWGSMIVAGKRKGTYRLSPPV